MIAHFKSAYRLILEVRSPVHSISFILNFYFNFQKLMNVTAVA